MTAIDREQVIAASAAWWDSKVGDFKSLFDAIAALPVIPPPQGFSKEALLDVLDARLAQIIRVKELLPQDEDSVPAHRAAATRRVECEQIIELVRALPAIPDQDFHCAACGVGVCRHYLESLNAICALPLDEYGAAYDLANDLRAILSGALPAIPLDHEAIIEMLQREVRGVGAPGTRDQKGGIVSDGFYANQCQHGVLVLDCYYCSGGNAARLNVSHDPLADAQAEIASLRLQLDELRASVPVLETPPPQNEKPIQLAREVWYDHNELPKDQEHPQFRHVNSVDKGCQPCQLAKAILDSGAPVEPVPAPSGIDPNELIRALHANLTPLAHVEVTDRRPYGMSEDTIQVWPITGVRSVVNHLALQSAPVPAPRLEDVLEEIKAERDRAEAKFPDQHLPNFPAATDFERQRAEMRGAQQLCERAHKAGEVTWWHVLREEACEAFAESDPAKLRAELLQVAAMSVRWIEDLDRAVLSPPVGPQE